MKIIAAEPVMMSKGMSANHGRFVFDPHTQTVTYIKYKGQTQGRVNLVFWLIITLFRAFRKDKTVFDYPIKDIQEVTLTFGKGPFQYGTLSLTVRGSVHQIRFKNDIKDEIVSIYEALLLEKK